MVQRIGGLLLAFAGLALAIYSTPFVTFLALGFFLLGLAAVILGMWLTVRRV